MFNCFWPGKEYAVVSRPVMGHLEVKALERYKFALTGPARLYHVYLDLGVTQLTYSNVGNLEHKTELAVTLTNTSIVREYNCPLAFIRSGYFGKHDPFPNKNSTNLKNKFYCVVVK